MSATTTSPLHRHELLARNLSAGRPNVRRRAAAVASSAIAAALGILPHVLHHAGPLAGAALLAGTAGTLLFGALGLVAAIPFLLRVHRRCGDWRLPVALLGLFAVAFSASAFVIGPAITGSESSTANRSAKPVPTTAPVPAKEGHASHHR